MTPQTQTHAFQAEVNEVLAIVVNSLYSHKEVFLRELISNASDALDKLAFRALTEHALLGEDRELRIELIPDQAARTLTIRDNGIGMSDEELASNLGTIARSGSRLLMQSLSADEKQNLALIGQFGVGFYSSYLVADRVTVTSRPAGAEKAWQWESEGKTGYTLGEATRSGRGTDVVLHLKPEHDEYLDGWRLRELVRKYSDYVRYPIRLQGEKGLETINSASALWTRSKSEITPEQYEEFYKHLAHDWQPPLAHVHFKVEGAQELSGLLFVPSHPPIDLFERKHGIRLFVKRVFIMEDCSEILPEWLRFVRGVVDSQDLPLNVSRELLQQDRASRQIKKQVTGKVLGLLEELAGDGERYAKFWAAFGRVLKEGVHADAEQRERIARLLRFASTKSDGLASLPDYVARMQPTQPGIYYVTADSLEAARHSPHIEALAGRGFEVLLLADPIDEWVVEAMPEFDGKRLIAAGKGTLDLPETDEAKQARAQKAGELKDVLGRLKTLLADRVEDVRITDRLTESPACLVSAPHGMSPQLERILRLHGQDVPRQKRVLELNPDHPVVRRTQRLAAATGGDDELREWCQLLYDQALLAEGSLPEDPSRFARAVSKLMEKIEG
jgi:molecular chaperone HtpG